MVEAVFLSTLLSRSLGNPACSSGGSWKTGRNRSSDVKNLLPFQGLILCPSFSLGLIYHLICIRTPTRCLICIYTPTQSKPAGACIDSIFISS